MQSTPSFTAETMALQRSFESHRPPRQRLFTDPYTDAFLRPSLRTLAIASGVPVLRRLAIRTYDLISQDPDPSAIIRTRIIDDAVTDASSEHPQCVLLGAGYDARRAGAALAGSRVFEVDHPTTQKVKRRVLAHLGLGCDHVTYVGVDFEHDDLAKKLIAAGFDRSLPTLFLWEGVTQYLARDAVESNIAVMKGLVEHGGLLIVTYVDKRARESEPLPGGSPLGRSRSRAGEPWIFGLLPDDAETFFWHLGCKLRHDISTLRAGNAYHTTRRRHDQGSALYRIATVQIP